MSIKGYIPKNIHLIYRNNKEKISRYRFDLLDKGVGNDLESHYAIVVSEESKANALENARKWARGYSTNTFSENFIENSPKEYRIVNLEIRSEGGRAWKVISEDDHCFDLREDALLYSLLNEGCKPGGDLVGKFIWAVVGSQIKLIPINSPIHEALLEATNLKSQKNLSKREIKPGFLYKTKSGDYFAFIGWINYLDIDVDHNNSYRQIENVIKCKEITNGQLWFHDYGGKTEKEVIEIFKKSKLKGEIYKYDVVQNKAVVDEIGFITEVDQNFRDDFIKLRSNYYTKADSSVWADDGPILSNLNKLNSKIQSYVKQAQRKGVYSV